MIRKTSNSSYDLTCDICGETKTRKSFKAAVELKKDLEWKSKKNKDNEWEDICTECLNA